MRRIYWIVPTILITTIGCTSKPFLYDFFNGREDYWTQPLTRAAYDGNLDAVKKILAKGIPPDGPRTKVGLTALNVAVEVGHYPVIEVLLKAGADPMLVSGYCSPIAESVMKGDLVSFQLMETKTELARIGSDNTSLLSLACGVCQPSHRDKSRNVDKETAEIVRKLIKAGCKSSEANSKGESPITMAAYWNKFEIVEILFENGADPYMKDSNSRAAWSIANENLEHSQKMLDKYTEDLQLLKHDKKPWMTEEEIKLFAMWERNKIEGCKRIIKLFLTRPNPALNSDPAASGKIHSS